jgi:hypothetical protein
MKKNQTKGSIPKLDLSKVKEKYKNNMDNKIIINDNHVKSNRSNNEYIEKLKFQLKIAKNAIKMFKKKIERMSMIIGNQKHELAKYKSKFELLEFQAKKTGASTFDRSNNVNNTSMVTIILF